ncbi:MAG: RsmB/NOP family class I SAM-dependent RNA methyltransferase [Verrucomicrobiota bacterium]
MSSLAIRIAADVISKSSREHPADTVLRDALASRRAPNSRDLREASRAVFNYYRWLGWMERERPLPAQIEYALKVARMFVDKPKGFADDLLMAKAVPDWIREHLEVSPAWTRTIQAEPRLWLRARPGAAADLAGKLGAAKTGPLPDSLEYKGEEDLFRRPEFHDGEFEIQDIASQAVGWLCEPKPGETWWDACSGQGGKLLHLSDLMTNKGLIWASDRAEWRLQKLKRRTGRARVFNYRAALWDGGAKLPTKTKFNGVLVDAPCSGVGTWQRNPHARWTTTAEDVRELAAVQQQLLANVAPSVKPGGKLIYAVCTLTRAETTDIAAGFQAEHPDFEPLVLPVESLVKEFKSAAGATSLMIWPQDLGGNGMFVAAWRRKG